MRDNTMNQLVKLRWDQMRGWYEMFDTYGVSHARAAEMVDEIMDPPTMLRLDAYGWKVTKLTTLMPKPTRQTMHVKGKKRGKPEGTTGTSMAKDKRARKR